MREKQVFRQLLDWGKGSICQECIYAETCKNAHEACVACNRHVGKDGSGDGDALGDAFQVRAEDWRGVE